MLWNHLLFNCLGVIGVGFVGFETEGGGGKLWGKGHS